ncbi:MAG TPA: hypothetical protein VMU20_10385, partial [Candidatus Dormibacteraeota bacterium]|nr:hypothetical protein [Candidatus Dormibacteraeota bacterium]
MRGMVGRMIAVLAVGVLAAGCGQPRGASGPAGPVSRSAQVTPLVAVLEAPFGSVPNAIRLVGLDGVEAARVPLPDDAEAVALG